MTQSSQKRKEPVSLNETHELLQAIIQSTQDAISVVDENGMGLLINPAYTKLIGLTEEEVLHKPATVDIAEGESVHLKVLKTGEAIKGAQMKVGPAKKEVLVDVAPLIVNGKLKGSVAVIHDVSEIRRLSDELDRAKSIIRRLEAKYTMEDIAGISPPIIRAKEEALRAAGTPATVLLRGESGTGKELFAHAIHQASNRSSKPFIRVNCAAVPDNLLESELFGYEEGAFTGARKGGRKGYFEEADGGTLFLDEIGEIPVNLQAKLLRALQEKEIVRIGSNKARAVDVRVIAATNANLEEKIKKGEFREDLFYRLNVMPIYIPPLRERKGDLPVLSRVLINKLNREYGRMVEGITPEAIDYLDRYWWPGNVRELENVLGRAIINMQMQETTIGLEHLPPLGASRQQVDSDPQGYTGETFRKLKEAWERDLLKKVLAAHNGNRTATAKSLGISIRSLHYKLKTYGLELEGPG
jgi:PAS domain S-box-containing protein